MKNGENPNLEKIRSGKNKILVLDAQFADLKQSPNVILAKFWHAVFSIVFLLIRSLHLRSRGLFDGHKVASSRLIKDGNSVQYA